jgi:hypothetical protein
MDVRVIEARSPLDATTRSALRVLDGPQSVVPPAGRIAGSGDALSLDPAQNNAFTLIGRAVSEGGAVRFNDGRYVVSGVGAKASQWATELALTADRTAAAAGAPVARRLALYKPHTASMDEGWTEWLLDQHNMKYTTITNADMRGGDLGARFDVILFASDGPRNILEGFAKGTVPPRYEGGIGDEGVRALDQFARAGGTLVFMNQSANFAIEQLHLPVKNVVGGVPAKEYFASGSILEVMTDPSQPVMAGMPERAKIFVDRSPVFTTLEGFEGSALAKYAPAGKPLLSGYLLGEKYLNGMAAALDVKLGAGHVVLIGFRPQWRGQPVGTFRVVFNSVLYGREVAARAKPNPGFWTAPKTEKK